MEVVLHNHSGASVLVHQHQPGEIWVCAVQRDVSRRCARGDLCACANEQRERHAHAGGLVGDLDAQGLVTVVGEPNDGARLDGGDLLGLAHAHAPAVDAKAAA